HRLEGEANALRHDARRLARSRIGAEHADGVLAATPAVATQVALGLRERPQALHGGYGRRPSGQRPYPARVADRSPPVFEYRVSTDPDWTAHSDRGGSAIRREEAWTPEHLVLAGLSRCTLKSLQYHAGRAGIRATATADAHGSVTRREDDGRFAFVEISVA